MSHSKTTRRGYSLYIEEWNPEAKKYINTCVLCGCRGYRPSVDVDDFTRDAEHRAIRAALRQTLSPLPLDGCGRCEDCARHMKDD